MATRYTLSLLLSLATAALSTAAAGKPNDVAPRPSFVQTDTKWGWVVTEEVDGELIVHPYPGAISPSHMAKIILPRNWKVASAKWIVEATMGSPVARELSQAQKDFWAEGFGVHIDMTRGDYPHHYTVDLYAVSEEDAKTMAWALLDTLTTRAQANLAASRHKRDEARQKQERRRVELAEQEKRWKEVERVYSELKRDIHAHINDDEAAQLAKELIFQMDKKSKTLDIELAGVQAKLASIEGYLDKPGLDDILRERFEAMKIDQLIELSSLNGREKAVERISIMEQRFYSVYSERRQFQQMVPGLRSAVKRGEQEIQAMTARLERPSGNMVPPRVYADEIRIHPVVQKSSQN